MEIYKREKIDAVLLEIKLPRTSGCDLFAKMKSMNPAVKVVISSGYVDADLEAQLLDAGVRSAIHTLLSNSERSSRKQLSPKTGSTVHSVRFHVHFLWAVAYRTL
jgi:DNA-binding NarL/FixJ family response regulator